MKRLLRSLYNYIPFKKQLFLLIKRIGLPPQHVYQHLYFHGVFTVEVTPECSFKIDHFGQQIENELFWCGLEAGWEKVSIGVWKKLCLDSKIILDIGANSGLYSMVAKALSPQSEVYAFEPVIRVYDRLVKNNTNNNFNICAEKLALSNYDGEGIIYDTSDTHILSVTVNKNLHASKIKSFPVKILTRKLSTYIKNKKISKVDLIKLDVETHEPEVLEGMEELLEKFKPILLIEVLSDEVGERIQAIVQNCNYLYFDIDEHDGIKQVSEIRKSSYYNYLLCSESIARKLSLI